MSEDLYEAILAFAEQGKSSNAFAVHCVARIAELERERDRYKAERDRLLEAAKCALNFIENTESSYGITLVSGDMLRASIASVEQGETA